MIAIRVHTVVEFRMKAKLVNSFKMPCKLLVQSLAIRTDSLEFSIQMPYFKGVENYLNVINFFSNACINVGSLSMSFGTKTFSGARVISLQI